MDGASAIIQAIKDGDVPVVEHLLTEDPGLVRAADDHLKRPLHWAAEYDWREIAKMLLDTGAELVRGAK